MIHQIQCESCGKKYKVPEKYFGRKVKCKKCGEPLPVPDKHVSESDAFISALDAVVEDDAVVPSAQTPQLPPRRARPQKQKSPTASAKKTRLTSQKLFLIQGLFAGGMLSGGWSLGWSIWHFQQIGFIGLFVETTLGIVLGAIVGGTVMFAAGKFDSALAGCVAGVLVVVPLNAGQAFLYQQLAGEMLPLNIYVYSLLGIPKGVIFAIWVFRTAKDIEVKEA